MDQEQKTNLLGLAREHIEEIQKVTEKHIQKLRELFLREESNLKGLGRADQMVHSVLRTYNERRLEELESLKPSPYFSRCDFQGIGDETIKNFYFGKFPLTEEGIYSWVSPIAALRFENPGDVSYITKKNEIRSGKMFRKDQYMIVGGEMKFFSVESVDSPRELIFQEHFSNRKTGFVLPEIVAQMEKAQDAVIRADHRGPFVLSGPAGSGKTTLALHRVAYLVQSPETAELFPAHSIVVFVQDTGTKTYFSKLLPELGIREVYITTFSQWAFDILGIKDLEYVVSFGETDREKDYYEYTKNKALHNEFDIPLKKTNTFSTLEQIYQEYFSPEFFALWTKQRKAKVLDRFDLTILLKLFQMQYGKLSQEKEYYLERKNGRYQKKKGRLPLEYTLAIVDEFQNYLPSQLESIKSTLSGREKSLVYVGDMAQQVQIGTIKSWSEMGETITDERKVILQKVYRNTKYILKYLQHLGYSVGIPEGLREGVPVQEKLCPTKEKEIEEIKNIAQRKDRGSLGILAKDVKYLEDFKNKFLDEKDIYFLSMAEAQGVEFDIVCIVGIDADAFRVSYPENLELQAEKEKIYKDLLYVALTRAMNELYIFGKVPLRIE